jgi:hypothetical protein
MRSSRGTVAALVTAAAVATAAAAPPNICATNATLGRAVLSVLNLTYPGLESVAAAAAAGDLGAACAALNDYYVNGNTTWWLRHPAPAPGTRRTGGAADALVDHDVFTFPILGLTTVVPRNADGGLDWLYKGPRNDVEAMNDLNRMDVAWPLLHDAWARTGNPVYLDYFEAMATDWVTHNPCPDAGGGGAKCVPAGLPGTPCAWGPADGPGTQACATGAMESPWRTLEAGLRMGGTWPDAFFGFIGAASPSSASVRALMVLGVGQHNAVLLSDGPATTTPNWEATQWQGLINSCVCWPELANCSALLGVGYAQLAAQLAAGVYPDGVETEQASSYDMVAAGDYFSTLRLVDTAGLPPPPPAFTARVEAMYDYAAGVVDPAGCLPRNGDSAGCGRGFQPAAAAYYNRSDWVYVHTNGAEGTPPAGLAAGRGPSTVYPWAGQVALRSGYEANATWGWFDVGPYGTSGHAHRDKLQLVLRARGSVLLVDSGRFAYEGTDRSAVLHREYAGYARAHNTLTVDGCDQAALPAVATAPLPPGAVTLARDADTACGAMPHWVNLSGTAVVGRGVHFQRPPSAAADGDGDWLVVVDALLASDRPRALQATWHAHPNATGVALNASTGVGVAGGVDLATGAPTPAQVCIVPAPAGGGGGWPAGWGSAALVAGVVADPAARTPWQGWYSLAYDDAWPAPTFVYDVGGVPPGAATAWLLVPTASRGGCDRHAVTVVGGVTPAGTVEVDVVVGGAPPLRVAVPVATAGCTGGSE